MTLISKLAAATGVCAMLMGAPAFAQMATTPAAPAASAPAAPMAPGAMTSGTTAKGMTKKQMRTAKSMQCSKDADAQNMHGKPRKKFMSTCKKSSS